MKKSILLIAAIILFAANTFANTETKKDGSVLYVSTTNFWLSNSLQTHYKVLDYQKVDNNGETVYIIVFRNNDNGITEAFVNSKIKLYTQGETVTK